MEQFLDALWAERGLSRNTLQSYRYDLSQLAAHQRNRGRQLRSASREDLLLFLAAQMRAGRSPRSLSRYLSGFRQFYRWLLREGCIARDPTALIESPKLGRGLPKALNEQQVTGLLEAPAADTALGLRDRTMLELMYASGLRVSELVGLEVQDVNLNQGVVRVTGKGGKERLVPIGRGAIGAVAVYLRELRPRLDRGGGQGIMLLNANGGPLTRMGAWKIVRKYVESAA
jgi:integrase/recombinase XerD